MNKSDVLNSLRDSTIQEYLHGDRNRSSFLAHQIKNSVARFEGALEPEKYEQMNELELRNVRKQKRRESISYTYTKTPDFRPHPI
jgi:hypothetical protein